MFSWSRRRRGAVLGSGASARLCLRSPRFPSAGRVARRAASFSPLLLLRWILLLALRPSSLPRRVGLVKPDARRQVVAPRAGKACGGRPEQSRAGKGKRGAEVLSSGGTVVALVSRIAALR